MTIPVYTEVSEVKRLFPSNSPGTTYDDLLESMIDVASREIDLFLRREPGAFAVSTDSVRYFDGRKGLLLWVDEIAAVPTTVAVAESALADNANGTGGTYTTWAVTDYFMFPQNAIVKGMPYHGLEINVQTGSKSTWYPGFQRVIKITGKFGFSTTVPPEIKKAAEIQTVRYFKRAQQAFADAGVITELGQMTYVKTLDPDVQAIISTEKFATSWL